MELSPFFFIIVENGRRTAVIIPLANYEAMLEDINDLASIAESKDRGTISLEELKGRLQADGLL